ncbi:bacteriocin immunity protein [Salmonella enterica]|uniref:STY3281 family bacteriocin immunity protein n=1 Tax=Salmonella enterica TaxID=28901 RepID=UPI0009ADF67A|nr:bacteriocin immunity protein [Salmonella enterica]EED3680017.1 bacteriocin immunity protein [Salmonella enterica subsp. enterica]EAM7547361.1 bacteriocin immunity protein [Salmonella enterica]EAU3386637.1 bacteriocin immunity protein [Salmonella enterica]EAU3439800.1 bacteriocin immunity protein [Salmonella enterica]EAW5080591.1 bacteriocin immunity protein [Salmonella enterica]
MKLKENISDYTESEFIDFLRVIFSENESDTDETLDPLLEYFEKITEYPDGTDLIYYPETESDGTPKGILNIIKEWRESQGLPCFKKSK